MTYARPSQFVSLGLSLAGLLFMPLLGAGGCADPCVDDGLVQKSCPSAQEAGGTAEETNSGAHEAEAGEAEAGGTCSNQTQDEGETDVDCGGVCVGADGTGKCDDGQTCEEDEDCVSDLCEGGLCTPRFPCTNGTQDPGETDVDCGGACVEDPNDPSNPAGKCDDGETCEVDSDCVTQACDPEAKVCVSVCNNGVFDPGVETDVDCGGQCVVVNPEDRNDVEGQCNDMDTCEEDMDCVAGQCSDGQCDVCALQDDYTVCQTCLVTSCCPSVQACLADIPKCVCWFNCIGQQGATVQGCMTSCGNGNIGTINSCLNNACKDDCQ